MVGPRASASTLPSVSPRSSPSASPSASFSASPTASPSVSPISSPSVSLGTSRSTMLFFTLRSEGVPQCFAKCFAPRLAEHFAKCLPLLREVRRSPAWLALVSWPALCQAFLLGLVPVLHPVPRLVLRPAPRQAFCQVSPPLEVRSVPMLFFAPCSE
jgi:hypothetical protein